MKWIKQIFGIKPEEDDTVVIPPPFANATKTNELVVSPKPNHDKKSQSYTKSSLNKLFPLGIISKLSSVTISDT